MNNKSDKKTIDFLCLKNDCIPVAIKEKLMEKPFPYNRTGEIIDYIRKNAIDRADIDYSIINYCLDNKNAIVRAFKDENGTEYYYGCCESKGEGKSVSSILIVPVDTSECWCIEETKDNIFSRELIKKIPKYELVDKDMNLWRKTE